VIGSWILAGQRRILRSIADNQGRRGERDVRLRIE